MKAADFEYARPESLSEALALLARNGAAPLAGGQSLLAMMNFREVRPALLVDLACIPEMKGLAFADGALQVGAMTRFAELARSPLVERHAPLLAAALPHLAHAAIRNRGTLGGSAAYADPAAEAPAALIALNATLHIQGPEGARETAAETFFPDRFKPALAPGDLIVSASIPAMEPGDGFGFYEIARRQGYTTMAGVMIARRAGRWRVVLFGALDRPTLLARDAETLNAEALQAAAAAAPFTADFNGGAAFKQRLAITALNRAMESMRDVS